MKRIINRLIAAACLLPVAGLIPQTAQGANTPPTISVTSNPPNGTTLSMYEARTITLTATAADADGPIMRVEFYKDGVLWGTDSAAPYTFSFPLSTGVAGTQTFSATAFDSWNASASASVSFPVIASWSPSVTLTSPSNGSSYTAPATITLSATATDADGIAKVEFYRGTTLLGTDYTSPYSLTQSSVPAGTYAYSAKAYDNKSLTRETSAATVTVTASNVPPTVSLTSPVNNSSFTAPASITLAATASDSNGISKVEFYNGSTLLGTDTTSPYSITLSGVAAGTYAYTAKAYDTLNASTLSAAVNATVVVANVPPGVALNPVADAYVLGGLLTAAKNYGTATELRAQSSSRILGNYDSYLKFDTSAASGQISSAKLRVYAALSDVGSVTTSAHAVGDTSWGETTITWNNKPALGISLGSITVASTDYAWQEIDVTAYVQSERAAGRSVISLGLHNDLSSSVYVTASSREASLLRGGGNPWPQLVITVNNPPSVSLTAPAGGSTYIAPASITLSADATDSDGSIAAVEFYDGATLIASLTTPPYTYTWNDVPAGSHSLTAKATDNQGASTSSAPVAVTVSEPLANNIYYIHADHLNTPRVITDVSNRVVWRWDSDPFGASTANEDPDGDGTKFTYNLRFPGQYYDRETNLHYNYFRDYDPTTGRYVQSDPIGLEGGINTYTYVGGNPTQLTDPLGLVPFGPVIGGGLGGGLTLSAGGAIGNGVSKPSSTAGSSVVSGSRDRNSCEKKCDDSTLQDIARRRKQWCKFPNQPQACLLTDGSNELFRKRYHFDQCIRARDEENMCKGVDPGHQQAVDDLSLGRDVCDMLILRNARNGVVR